MNKDILDQELLNKKDQPLFKIRPIIIWAIPLTLGIICKIMHWPYAGVLVLIPSAGLQAYCINGIIKPKERNNLNTTLSLLGIVWLIILIGGVLFNEGRPFNLSGLKVYGITFTIYCIIYLFYYFIKK